MKLNKSLRGGQVREVDRSGGVGFFWSLESFALELVLELCFWLIFLVDKLSVVSFGATLVRILVMLFLKFCNRLG